MGDSEEREQAGRLAIPQIRIGQGPVEPAQADQRIELLIIIRRRIAEPDRSSRDDHERQDHGREPARLTTSL